MTRTIHVLIGALLAAFFVAAPIERVTVERAGFAGLELGVEWNDAKAAASVDSDAAARGSFTTDASPDLAFAGAVSAGALLIASVYTGTDETTTISSVEDSTANGSWTLISGPTDHPNTTMRTWFYCYASSAAGTPTVTVNLSAAITTQVAVAAFDGVSFAGGGACGADAVGTPATTSTNTTYTSNSITISGAGVIVSGLSINSGNTITMGSDEVNVTNANSRAHIMASIQGSGTSRTHVATGPSTTSAQHIAAWLEASAMPDPPAITSTSLLQSGQDFTATGTDFTATGNSLLLCPTDDIADMACETQTITTEGTTSIFATAATLPTGADPGETLYAFVITDDALESDPGFAVLVADPVLRTKAVGSSSLIRDGVTGDSVDDTAARTIVLSLDTVAAIVHEGDYDITAGVLDDIVDADFTIFDIADVTEFLIVFPDGGGSALGEVVDRNP